MGGCVAGAACVTEGWRGRVGVSGTWVGASSMVVSEESLLVDGERVRGVDVREAMLGCLQADSLSNVGVDCGAGAQARDEGRGGVMRWMLTSGSALCCGRKTR